MTAPLHQQICLQNKIRKTLYEVCVLAADERSPLTARDMLAVQESKSFSVFPEKYLACLEALKAELESCLSPSRRCGAEWTAYFVDRLPCGKGI